MTLSTIICGYIHSGFLVVKAALEARTIVCQRNNYCAKFICNGCREYD